MENRKYPKCKNCNCEDLKDTGFGFRCNKCNHEMDAMWFYESPRCPKCGCDDFTSTSAFEKLFSIALYPFECSKCKHRFNLAEDEIDLEEYFKRRGNIKNAIT